VSVSPGLTRVTGQVMFSVLESLLSSGADSHTELTPSTTEP